MLGLVGLTLSGNNGMGGSAPASYTAEAQAIFARMTTPPSTGRKGLINAVTVALLAGPVSGSNIWAKLDALYVMAAADSQAAGLNWIANQYNLTPTNSPTFTTDRGYAGNGSTSYLDTGFNPTTATTPQFALNSAHLSVWSRTAAQSSAVDAGQGTVASGNINPGIYLRCRNASDSAVVALNSATSGIGNGASGISTDGSGHFLVNRSGATSGSSDTALYRNGSAISLSGQDASISRGNANIMIGAGNGTNASAREFAAATIGGSLTANENTDLYNALNTYLVAVGAA